MRNLIKKIVEANITIKIQPTFCGYTIELSFKDGRKIKSGDHSDFDALESNVLQLLGDSDENRLPKTSRQNR